MRPFASDIRTPARTSLLAAIRPRARPGRIAAGILAGTTGAVVLGLPLYAVLLVDAELLLGPLEPGAFWAAHMIASIAIGIAFSLVVSPQRVLSSIAWSVTLVMTLVWAGGNAAIAALGGPAPALDARLLLDAAGHLLFALTLGASYVAYHHMMIADARASPSLRWRLWAKKEERSACGGN